MTDLAPDRTAVHDSRPIALAAGDAMEAALAILTAGDPQTLVAEVARRAVSLTGAARAVGRIGEDGGWPGLLEASADGEAAREAHAGGPSDPRAPSLRAPLVARDGRTVGSLEVSPAGADPFPGEVAHLVGQLAAFAASALENMRVHRAMADAQAQREAFFGILSHELRTPITTIYGGTRMLVQADGRLSHDARREVQADIAADAERLYRLIEDLLVLTRSEHGSLNVAPEPVLLQRLLPRVLDSERTRWPSVRFRLDLPVGSPPVVGEETYVEQVVRNLLSNAGKYGGSPGDVVLKVAIADREVEIRVLDEGPGLGTDDPDSLFRLFYRTDTAVRRASGAGIGLYACRELVSAMGGRIWARARAEGGSEFGFALRIFDEEA